MVDESALILVVDDNEMNRDMLSRRLNRLGHETVVAEDGEKAIQVIQEQSFDLVLLDIMMPILNGYDTLERIKSDEAMRHIPVIMISAVDDLDSVVRCIEMGAEDYLFKPFNPVLLKARVGASLEKNRLRKTDSGSPHVKILANEIHQGLKTLDQSSGELDEMAKKVLQDTLKSAETLLNVIT